MFLSGAEVEFKFFKKIISINISNHAILRTICLRKIINCTAVQLIK